MNESDGHRPLRPSAGARIDILDQMRGLALLAIFLCNLVALSGASAADGTPGGWVYLGVHIGLGDSSRTLFSFMFGISMLLVYEGAARRGRRPYATLLRRMLTLLLIGGIHLFGIWSGDILFMYALDGLMLLAFLWMSPVWQLVSGIVLLILTSSTLQSLSYDGGWRYPDPSALPFRLADGLSLYDHPRAFLLISEWQLAIQHLPFFLFGMYAYRKGIFRLAERFPRRFIGIGLALLAVGLAGKAANSFGYAAPWLADIALVYPFAYVAATLGAVCCILALGRSRGAASRVLALFGPVGRMAFTCYLLQSLIYVSVFAPTGEGLFASIGWVGVLPYGRVFAGSLLFFAAQMAFAYYWQRRFLYGPFEWLWRIGTNLEIPAFRRRRPAQPVDEHGGLPELRS
ncbi:DUF418 domain-containing protein [Saccharibacillus sp. CPCC 101409]|uniref:DUF418 domain-containing protein n=1 Tax=Saccharibacillus sp. CPCC 101409 TaxID=3058041 RepID=UPI0026726924|nr:DUF418 domain-containing protein [Saccharibacillus sp. CPCC 101409]MDO3411586.1 DUF418 domain-containing protein [Saccharibacillus sp. CPCC 101409]